MKDASEETALFFLDEREQFGPLREVQRKLPTSYSDDFKNLLKELGYVLSDCQALVKTDQNS